MITIDKKYIYEFFNNKRVVIIGSAPSCKNNDGKEIDNYDIIVRVNNYKINEYSQFVGTRTDVFYSFFGASVRKKVHELKSDKVKFCMCKCPDAYCHKGIVNPISNFQNIYKRRRGWWFTPVYIPTEKQYMKWFNLLGGHVPTTGFACILDISELEPKELYITGFDFFTSKIHNVNEPWRLKNPDDPIGHRHEKEKEMFKNLCSQYGFIKLDSKLKEIIGEDANTNT